MNLRLVVAAYLVQGTHRGGCGRNDVANEKEERILGTQMDAFADQKVELADGQVGRHQVLLLVQITDVGLGRLLDNDLAC